MCAPVHEGQFHRERGGGEEGEKKLGRENTRGRNTVYPVDMVLITGKEERRQRKHLVTYGPSRSP